MSGNQLVRKTIPFNLKALAVKVAGTCDLTTILFIHSSFQARIKHGYFPSDKLLITF